MFLENRSQPGEQQFPIIAWTTSNRKLMSTPLMNHRIWIIHIKHLDFLEGHPAVATTYGILTMELFKVVKNSHEPREKNRPHDGIRITRIPRASQPLLWPQLVPNRQRWTRQGIHGHRHRQKSHLPLKRIARFGSFCCAFLYLLCTPKWSKFASNWSQSAQSWQAEVFFRKEVTHPCTLCL